MAWRNLWRNPRRSVLTLSAIAFAGMLLVFMLSFQFGAYDTMINSSVKLNTGHLKVQAEGYERKQKIDRVVTDPGAVAAALDRIPAVSAYTFRARAFSLVSTGERTFPSVVVGIDPDREAAVSTLKDSIRSGAFLAEGDSHAALIGETLADQLNVGPGDELTLLGQGRYGAMAAAVVNIKGIYRSGQDEFDRTTVHIPIGEFQEAYFMHGAVHEVVANVTSLSQVPAVRARLQAGLRGVQQIPPLAVLDWKALQPGLYQGIQIDLASGVIFYFILIVVIAFSILNTFLMAIFERTREFGVLMAIGITPHRLTRLLLMESMSMAVLGITAGVVFGSLITGYFQVKGIDFSSASELLNQFGISSRLYPRLSLLTVAAGPVVLLCITCLAALYPALRVRALRPVEAMAHA